jgi:integrase/recombinase XerC
VSSGNAPARAFSISASAAWSSSLRTYLSRVRQYLAWLAGDDGARRSHGDPLTQPAARDWAVRDYRRYLLRGTDPKRSVRYANNALAALDDFHVRRGLGKAGIARDDLPRPRPAPSVTTPRSGGSAPSRPGRVSGTGRWPSFPCNAGLRIGDAVALDVDDVRISARTGELVVYGKGGKVRTVPVAVPLRKPLQDWLDERRTWPGSSDTKALFLNRRGGRLSARGASDVFTAIAENAGLDEPATAHVGRHTFINELIRGGEDLVLVAELAGHARASYPLGRPADSRRECRRPPRSQKIIRQLALGSHEGAS